MKTTAITLLAALTFSLAALAADDHGHAHGHSDGHDHAPKTAGPNGGKILTAVEPHAEFFVTADRKIQITFLDSDGKPVPPAGQTITVTAGERSAPTTFTFVPSGDTLISEQVLPSGENFPTVVQVKTAPDAKTIVEKFNLNLAKCPSCAYAEYACTCAH